MRILNYVKYKLSFWGMAILLPIGFLFGSCKDEVDESDLYTFVGETVTDYLAARDTMFSSFLQILKISGVNGLTSAYGNYTVFAPTNQAVEAYLDSLYNKVLEPEHGGLKSPYVEDLTPSMAKEIAYTHLLNQMLLTSDMADGSLPIPNMNERYLFISYDSVSNQMTVNTSSQVLVMNEEVENGVIHVLNRVVSPSNSLISDLLLNNENFKIFSSALFKTGLNESLMKVIDEDYVQGEGAVWEGMHLKEPEQRKFAYTILAEEDVVLNKYDIYSIEDLYKEAAKVYGTEDADDYTSPNNALYKYIAYHLLNQRLDLSVKYFNDNQGKTVYPRTTGRVEVYEYYETMLTNRLVKFTTQGNVTGGMRVNRPSVGAEAKPGILIKTQSETNYDMDAINGAFYCLTEMLFYAPDIFEKERLRFDMVSFMPEMTNSGIRFNGYMESGNKDNINIPAGFVSVLKASEKSVVSYLRPNYSWHNYMGDEFNIVGQYDVTFTLPPIPKQGTYEIRMGYKGEDKRGVAQIYVDGIPVGIPTDLRISTTTYLIGYELDSSTDDSGFENDKMMRNRGYMKGPSTIGKCSTSDGNGTWTPLRDYSTALRKIVYTGELTEGVHTLRAKSVLEDENAQFMIDYIEIVPKSIWGDLDNPEDRL